MYLSKIRVTLRPSILDPQGKAVEHAIATLGVTPIREVRMGKYVELQVDSATEAEARKNIEESARLFITSCFERGTLEDVLKECGFRVTSTPLSRKTNDKNFITVPIPFSAKNQCRIQCHV